MPAQTKRYYSVKEAAKLLGVSTNTIYTYLKEEKIKGVRIGRGRIKIPFREIYPFLNLPLTSEKIYDSNDGTKDFSLKLQDSSKPIVKEDKPPETNNLYISSESGDIIFYRLFKALFLLGLGVVFLLTKSIYFENLNFSNPILFSLFNLLPVWFFSAGILCLFRILFEEKTKRWDSLIHLYQVIVLGFVLYVSLVAEHFGLVIFLAAILTMISSHFTRGFHLEDSNSSFKIQFVKYLLILVLISSWVIIFGHTPFPFDILIKSLGGNKEIAALFWTLFFVPLLLFVLSPSGRKNKIAFFFIGIYALLAFFLGTELLVKFSLDVSYLAFLTSFFGLFLTFWEFSNIRILKKRVFPLILAGLWVSLSIILGISAIGKVEEDIKDRSQKLLLQRLESLTRDLEDIFKSNQSVLVSFSTNPELKSSIIEKDKTKSLEFSKKIYEKVRFARRLVLFNEEGIAVSAYPHNSLVVGTNFSSRDYFQKTKETFKGYITPVFEGITGVPIVIQTEPIFLDNSFKGMIGLSYSLSDLSSYLIENLGSSYEFWAIDENGVNALADESKIGTNYEKKDLDDFEKVSKSIRLRIPNWEVYASTKVDYISSDLSNIAFFISSLLIINAVVSVAFGIILSSGKEEFIQISKFSAIQALGRS